MAHAAPDPCPAATGGDAALARLVASHRDFLAFLERRVGRREDAEEILQAAFVRSVERADELDPDGQVVAWFYRLLRNALVDHHRRRDAERRALERAAQTFVEPPAEDPELRDAVCRCVLPLVETLEPSYADMLREVDLAGRRLADVAGERGLTANNARVRLHRARKALGRQVARACGTCASHGCEDCTCE